MRTKQIIESDGAAMFPIHDDNPTELNPVLTIALICACTLVYLWQVSNGSGGQRIIYALGAIPSVLFKIRELSPEIALIPAPITIVTSMFLHGSFMHLAGNMLYLWIFGNNVEDAMGHARFIAFYLLCGLAAVMAQAIPDPQSTIPMIGASGAISGVLGAYLLLYPHARVLVLIPFGFILHTTRLPASWVLGIWFLFQLLSGAASAGQQGGVAFRAHVGGFVAGMILIPVFRRRSVPLFHQRRRRSPRWK
jgi:membrane associated rhomboid family serine protease